MFDKDSDFLKDITEDTWCSFRSYGFCKSHVFPTFSSSADCQALRVLLLYIPVLIGSYWSMAVKQFTKFVRICKLKYEMRIVGVSELGFGFSFVPSNLVTFVFTSRFSSIFHYCSNAVCMILEQIPHSYR